MWSESLISLYYRNKEMHNEFYKKRFESENSYHFVININDNEAFFYYHKDILKMISDISFLDKKVETLVNGLPNEAKHSYIKKSLIDEILYTNEIEGVISTRKEINEIIENIKMSKKIKPNKINSLINKYMMLLDNNHSSILNASDVRNVYDELVLDEVLAFDENDKPDGVIFRKNGVDVKNEVSGRIIHKGVMPEAKIIEYISIAVNFLNDESIIPLIRIAAFHYLFSFIHPFYDGNGRINRFVSSMYLKKYYSAIIPYRLSLTIKENKKQYYDAFDNTNNTRNKGDISTFIFEFVDIVRKAYEKTIEYLTIKSNELEEKSSYIEGLELSPNESETLWYLYQRYIFKDEDAKIDDIIEFLGLSEVTTRNILKQLLKNGYISQKKDSKFMTYFVKSE